QRRRRSACAIALPDDPHRGKEAGAEGIRRGSGAHRQDRGAAQRTGRARNATRHLSCAAVRGGGDGGQLRAASLAMLTVGLDIGSTTVKATAVADGKVLWQHYA